MKSIYNISKAQLVTIWVFLGAGWFWLNSYQIGSGGVNYFCAFRNCNANVFLLWAIPFILIFYTAGWWNNQNKNKGE